MTTAMTMWTWALVGLLGGGLLPALLIGARGGAVERLVGLELATAVTTLVLLLLAQQAEQSSYLIVPLVLVVVSFAGTLVYTRLLGPQP